MVHPEKFNPPFIRAINALNEETTDTSTWLVIRIICFLLDVLYSVLRLVLATAMTGMIVVCYVVLTTFLYVTLRRRWRLLFEVMKSDILVV